MLVRNNRIALRKRGLGAERILDLANRALRDACVFGYGLLLLGSADFNLRPQRAALVQRRKQVAAEAERGVIAVL